MGKLFTRSLLITNKRGLHARASAKFVRTVEGFDAHVSVSRSGETVNGASIMGLLMLAASKGSRIEVAARGAQAEAAIEALTELVQSRFNED